MIEYIRKRDGRLVPFEVDKIAGAIYKAFQAVDPENELKEALEVSKIVEQRLEDKDTSLPTVELVQDTVEEVLLEKGYIRVAKAYILYRAERTKDREMKSRLMQTLEEITFPGHDENWKITDGDNSPMSTLYKYGSAAASRYNEMFILSKNQVKAQKDGDIHIGDMDFLMLTTNTCCIDLQKVFKDGFNTGHGFLREPNNIRSYASLACIIIQSNQNEQHGDQSIVNFDKVMGGGVRKTYSKMFYQSMLQALKIFDNPDIIEELKSSLKNQPSLDNDNQEIKDFLVGHNIDPIDKIMEYTISQATNLTNQETYQAMEALVHNLNTMNSHSGAQVPFSSITYGLDTTRCGRMVVDNILRVIKAGVGHNQTPIYPKQIFVVKQGVNLSPKDPNYDLLQLALDVLKTRDCIKFAFNDASFNKVENLSYSRSNIRVQEDINGKANALSRGNLSITTINLVRLALKAAGNQQEFFNLLEQEMSLVTNQLLDRYDIQSRRHVYNYPFLMGEGVWIDSKTLDSKDEVGPILKYGTMSVGYIGLNQCVKSLVGCSLEDEVGQTLGLKIINHMKDYVDKLTVEKHLNFNLYQNTSKETAKEFVDKDVVDFGVINGITDNTYQDDLDVDYKKLIEISAPYHPLTLGGHLLTLTVSKDDDLMEIIKLSKEHNIGLLEIKIK